MYACIDQCLDKVTTQIRRYKDKVRDHKAIPREQRDEEPEQESESQ
jgi:ribosome-associated translation inhibitor RaiA